ncbi:MAG: M14 family zinc carboxypeptidase [Saprospiraceae bacterium]
MLNFPFQALFLCFILLVSGSLQAQKGITDATPFEQDSLSSASYEQAIAHYEVLAKAYPKRCSLVKLGPTDSGEPLFVFIITDERKDDVQTFFVNNGIHAGEPCGIDASMMFARDLVAGKLKDVPLVNAQVAIIPVYNIGGALNRGSYSRANQNGPKAYGFRGNSKNLDLNRDFIKHDSRNADWLTVALRAMSPDVFIDTHTTNGADYQYDITVIATQPEKLGPVLGPYMRDQLLPALYRGVEAAGHPVSPYVYSNGVPQEAGIMPFIESPRYSSGYAALHHSLAFITEAHMLKPFNKRVRATEAFLHTAFDFWLDNKEEIAAARKANMKAIAAADEVVLKWQVDSSRADTLNFRGYTPVREPSKVTGAERLRYDREQPQTVPTVYHAYAKPALSVPAPKAYYIPQAYAELIDGIPNMFVNPDATRLKKDTVLTTHAYFIEDYQTSSRPYEGHYLHYGVEVRKTPLRVQARAGDLILILSPENLRLYTAKLEPQAPDSYFAWGFFDSWLQQKEHYSSYVFEETAARMLATDMNLKAEFEKKKRGEDSFRQNPKAQLEWLYQQSVHYEQPMRYPILRLE